MARPFSRLAKSQPAIRIVEPDLDGIFLGDPGCGQLCGNWNHFIQRIAGSNGHYFVWSDFLLADLSPNFLFSWNLFQGTKGLEVINDQHPVDESDLSEDQPVYHVGLTP